MTLLSATDIMLTQWNESISLHLAIGLGANAILVKLLGVDLELAVDEDLI